MLKQIFVASAAPVLALSALLMASSWGSGTANSALLKRASAAASFAFQDKSGCIASEVSVFVRKGSDNQERLELRVLKIDECKESALLNIDADVSLPVGAFRVAPDLSFASLNTSIRVVDRHSRSTVTATVHVTWKAAEKAVTAQRNDETRGNGKFIRLKHPAQLSMRMAGAAGVVSLPTTSIALSAAESAWIADAQGGEEF